MLEIPESRRLAKQLAQTFTGKTIVRVWASASPHRFAFFNGDPADYPALLEGRSVTSAVSLAGQVELALEQMRLLFGDGVNLRMLSPGERRPAKHQLLVEFSDGFGFYGTVSMYGGLWAFREGENNNPYYLAAKEKPSPLTAAFDADYFAGIWQAAKPTLSVKALLAAEQRIPGLGTGVLQDILFAARLNPQSHVGALDRTDRDRLFSCMRQVLREMTEAGGRDTERGLFGEPGCYHTKMSAKNYPGFCPVCGAPVVRKAFLGGNVYFCPKCQPVQK